MKKLKDLDSPEASRQLEREYLTDRLDSTRLPKIFRDVGGALPRHHSKEDRGCYAWIATTAYEEDLG